MNKNITLKSTLGLFSGTACVTGIAWALHHQMFAVQDLAKAAFLFQPVAILKALGVVAFAKLGLATVWLFVGTAGAAALGVWANHWVLGVAAESVAAPSSLLVSEALLSPWLLYWAYYRKYYGKLESDFKVQHYKALTHQIHHHFLFNTLNTAVCLIAHRPAQAVATLENLALLYREMLNQKSMNTVAEEMRIAKSYLRIEQLRLGARLTSRWLCAPEVLNCRIPSMTLQPLLENAVRHGVETSTQQGQIGISIRAQDAQRIAVVICNPHSNRKRLPGSGCTHPNLRQRMAICYGEANFQFLKHQQESSYCVELILPSTKGGIA